jgi:hypothetical protein
MSQLEVSMRNMPSVQATKSENEISVSRLYRLVMALATMQKPSGIIFPRNKLLAFDRPWLTQPRSPDRHLQAVVERCII